MRGRLIVAVGGAYALLALAAAAKGQGWLSLAAMLVMLLAMNLWMKPRQQGLDNSAEDKAAAKEHGRSSADALR